MEPATFERFRQLIYHESGIVLGPHKLPLLASRIQKRLSTLGVKDESAYLEIIELDTTGEELILLIDAISTNVTYFYREPDHFVTYREIVARLADEGRPSINIWCAAASSGEEPYTLAFETLEALDGASLVPRFLATDICLKVLRKAVDATYPESTVEPIPQLIRRKYLAPSGIAAQWTVIPRVRELVLFKRLNLVEHPYPLQGPIDVIFCRNVMIYFDNPTRERVVAEFTRLLAPGGYLFLSHSENLLGVNHRLKKISASVFRKEG